MFQFGRNTSPLLFYASIIRLNDDTILLHSWIKRYQEPEQRASTFWQTIFQDKNTILWKHLYCDGDGSWIWQGLCCGTLLIVHNGSYIKEVSTKICLAAVMIQCTSSKMICKCTIAEFLDSASSYRGKILGAILTQLIL